VDLDAESKREWRYVRQHLASSHLWQAEEECKEALAADIAARLTLMDRIAFIVRDDPIRGGLGLSVEPDLGLIRVTKSEVTIYYVFTIFDQVLSRAVGVRHGPKRREEFNYQDSGYPEVVSLGGIPVVRSTGAGARERAVSFLIDAQESSTSLPETAVAAQAYLAATGATGLVNDEVQDVLLMLGFPPGSSCDLCRPWFGISQSSPPAQG